MRGNRSNIHYPLFPQAPDVWESLDNKTKQEVETLIARLLFMHVDRQLPQPTKQDNPKEKQ